MRFKESYIKFCVLRFPVRYAPVVTNPGSIPTASGIDAWANLTNISGVTGKTSTESLSCPAGVNNQLTTCGYVYDAAGNVTSMPAPVSGNITYVYDAENRLVWTSGTTTAYRYIYDGNGERVEKCQAASATTACPTSGTTGTLYWRGTGSDTLAETDLAGNDEEEYIFFDGQRIARRDTTSTGTTIAVHYYFSNRLGSHGVVENAAGTACEQDIDYYPYGGQEFDYCANVPQNYKFTGKERDAETGLDNFGARFNASMMARFMSPDPLSGHAQDPQTLNKYAYVRNNPLNMVDPTGMDGGSINDYRCYQFPCIGPSPGSLADRFRAAVWHAHEGGSEAESQNALAELVSTQNDVDPFEALLLAHKASH